MEMQQQQQMQDQALQKQQEIEQMKIDATMAEKEKDRQRDILVAEIRAAGYGSMSDVNQNMMSDYQDAMAKIQQQQNYTDSMNLKREQEVNKNRNAACPFGVATLGRFVPLFIAIANKSNCSLSIAPLSNAAFTSLI